jgi:hypothetical protein
MRAFDPVRVALALALLHGVDDAIVHVALEVDRSADGGDEPGRTMWRRVLALLDEMRRVVPHRSERLH